MPAVRRSLILILAACVALAIAGCGSSSDSTSSTSSSSGSESEGGAIPTRSAEEAQEGTKPKVEVPSGAPPKKLVEKDLIEGEGEEAKAGDKVTVQYVGVLYDNGKEFDASWNRGEPFAFTLGNSEVIAGWDQGIEGMKVGGRRELIIPPQLAYGSEAVGPIPANSTLVFVVDLLAVN
jgi:FKBP-type peptidyl-prolyl cis-trans isomerase